ncbi:protein takeout [Drosophila tropicalis]|uniref:protein takeout n=1 Tax=Drosophila tropicalis TaxID=46794 RepID=UPI0035AC06B0
MLRYLCLVVIVQLFWPVHSEAPAYIKQCRRDDPKLVDCFIGAVEHLKPYLASGIPEIQLPSVEPFKMDSLALQLTEGPQGYKITLKNMEAYGASNFQVKSLILSENNEPFKARIIMPKLKIEAKYTSSGVLLIIPASGGGDFHATFEGVSADLTGKTSVREVKGAKYLHIDSLGLVLDVKDVKMSISRAFNNNRILLEATNLFLSENSQVVLEAMQAQLQKKLASEFGKLANQLLKNVPIEQFYVN